eukprot:g18528.t1
MVICQTDLKLQKSFTSDFLGFGFEACTRLQEIKKKLRQDEARPDVLRSTWCPKIGNWPYNDGLWTVVGQIESK